MMKKQHVLPIITVILATTATNQSFAMASRVGAAARQFVERTRFAPITRPTMTGGIPKTCPMDLRKLGERTYSTGTGAGPRTSFTGNAGQQAGYNPRAWQRLLGSGAFGAGTYGAYSYLNTPKDGYVSADEKIQFTMSNPDVKRILDIAFAETLDRVSNGPKSTVDSLYWNRNPNADNQLLELLLQLKGIAIKDVQSADEETIQKAFDMYNKVTRLINAVERENTLFQQYRRTNRAAAAEVTEKTQQWLPKLVAASEKSWQDALEERVNAYTSLFEALNMEAKEAVPKLFKNK